MSEAKVFVHGERSTHTEYVKIIDKSRRAYSSLWLVLELSPSLSGSQDLAAVIGSPE